MFRFHLALAGRAWARRFDARTRRLHAVTHLLVLGAVVASLAAVEPFGLAGLLVVGLLAFWAPLDLPSASLVAALLGCVVMFGQVAGTPWPFLAVALVAVAMSRAAVRVYNETTREHLTRSRADLVLALLGAAPYLVLFALFERGYRPRLRKAVEDAARGELGEVRNRPWQNWARTASCTPRRTFYPRSTRELIDIVQLARTEGRRIRVVATGHSWTPLSPTGDFLVNVRGLDHVSVDRSDPDRPLVVVGPGATVDQVDRALAAHGLALPSNVVLTSVRWGGLVATGSHGSGIGEPTLSDYVQALEVVTGTGELRRFDASRDPADVMNAARVHLGLFGILTSITLRVQPAFRVRMRDRVMATDEVLEQLEALVLGHAYCDLFLQPCTNRVWVRMWDATEEPLTPRQVQGLSDSNSTRDSRWSDWLSFVQAQWMNVSLAIMRRVPSLSPAVCRINASTAPTRDAVIGIDEATHYRAAIEAHRMGCIEVAFAIEPDFDVARRAIRDTLDRLAAWGEQGRYPVNVTINVRFIAGSGALLSPAGGNRRTCYLEVLGDHRGADWSAFMTEFFELHTTRPPRAPPLGQAVPRRAGDRGLGAQQSRSRSGSVPGDPRAAGPRPRRSVRQRPPGAAAVPRAARAGAGVRLVDERVVRADPDVVWRSSPICLGTRSGIRSS